MMAGKKRERAGTRPAPDSRSRNKEKILLLKGRTGPPLKVRGARGVMN
jgi:hypothetical protein